MPDRQRGSGVQWYGPSTMGRAMVVVRISLALMCVVSAVGCAALATQEPSFAVASAAMVAVTLGAALYARPFAVAIGISDHALVVRGPLGVRRVRWASISDVWFWTDPRTAAIRGGLAPPVCRWYVRGRPFVEGITLTVPGHWTTGQYVAISETMLMDGRQAVTQICRRAGYEEPAEHVLPRTAMLASSRAWRAVYYLLIVILAVYPVFRLLRWQSDRTGHAALGDTPWEIAFMACQIGLFTTFFWALIPVVAAQLKMAAEYQPEDARW